MTITPIVPTVCTIDALPSNGYINSSANPRVYSVGDTVKHGETIGYLCQHGYKLQGNAKRECADGEWTSEAPVCEPKGAYRL